MIDSDSARESGGSRAAQAFRTTADAIIDDLTVRCLAYNVAQKYGSPAQEILASATLTRWGDLMNLSPTTIERTKASWRSIVHLAEITTYGDFEQ